MNRPASVFDEAVSRSMLGQTDRTGGLWNVFRRTNAGMICVLRDDTAARISPDTDDPVLWMRRRSRSDVMPEVWLVNSGFSIGGMSTRRGIIGGTPAEEPALCKTPSR